METYEPHVTLLHPVERLIIQLSRRESARSDGGISLGEIGLGDLEAPGALDSFLELATHHGVRGLVLTHLQRLLATDAVSTDVPSTPLLEELSSSLPLLQKQATLWELEQERVLSSLKKKGLRPLVLKGGALRHFAYQAPVERPMGDLDVLTSPEEVPAFLEALAELGYSSEYPEEAKLGFREHHYHERVTHPNGFMVEVHWGLTRPTAYLQLSHEWFFRRARPLQTGWGTPMLVPSPEDMILHLVSQAEQGGFLKLSRIVDLDRVVAASEGLDWDYIRDRAEEGRLRAGLAISLRLANLLLLTPAPSFLVEGKSLDTASLRALEFLRPVPHLMRARKRGRVAADDLFRIWCLPTWSLRRKAFSELAAGSQDPLLWVWEERDHPEEDDPGRNRGLTRVSKLLAFQLWIGTKGLAGSIFLPGRRRVRFWGSPTT